MILIGLVAATCCLLLVLGFLLPCVSRRPQHAVDRALDLARAQLAAAGNATDVAVVLQNCPFQIG